MDDGTDPVRALVACHPACESLAVAVGTRVGFFDPRKEEPLKTIELKETTVRSIAFSPNGSYIAICSDDKVIRVFDVDTWKCETYKSPKRLSRVLFAPSSDHVLAANKFGDILVAPVVKIDDQPSESPMNVFLGHFCSTITSVAMSRDESLIASSDRDGRIRITAFPQNPMDGAHEIVSFCLGHENFVSVCAFVSEGKREYLLTGGGDNTLKLWDPLQGKELDSVGVSMPPLAMVSNVERNAVITTLDGSCDVLVASAREGKIQIDTYKVNLPVISDVSVAHDGKLWFAGGPLGSTKGLHLAASELVDHSLHPVELSDSLKALENCGPDDQPLHKTHLPDFLDKSKPHHH